MKDFFQDLKNNFDFSLRQGLNFSRKNYCEKNEPKEGLFTSQEQIESEKRLFEKYNLDFLKNNSTKENYQENLYTLDLLDKHLTFSPQNSLKVLDIGCKNWFYAKGEYFFFKKHCKDLTFDGIEIDTQRLYSNLYSRAEVAKFHTKGLENTNYIKGDFLNHKEKYDYFIWFLPFVFEYPHQKWGLPKKYFKPEEMLLNAYKNLNEGGKIFIVNQGKTEFKAQKELCGKLNIPYHPIGIIESTFLKYKHERYLIIAG